MKIAFLESLTFGLDLIDRAVKELGHEAVLLCRDRSLYYGLEKLHSVRAVDVDTFDYQETLEKLRELNVDALISNTDTWALVGARLCADLNLPGRSVDFTEKTRSKHTIRNLVKDIDNAMIHTPILHSLSIKKDEARRPRLEAEDSSISMELPVVIKPNSGTASNSIFVIRTLADLDSCQRRIKESKYEDWLIESYCPGPLWSAEVFVYQEESNILGLTSRLMSPEPYSREEGFSFPALLGCALENKAKHWIREMLAKIAPENGYYHIEFTYWQEKFYLIELNPRMGGATICYALEKTKDWNPYLPLIQLALGEEPTLPEKTIYTGGYATLLLYANKPGIIKNIEIPDLDAYPGTAKVFLTKQPGNRVDNVDSQAGN